MDSDFQRCGGCAATGLCSGGSYPLLVMRSHCRKSWGSKRSISSGSPQQKPSHSRTNERGGKGQCSEMSNCEQEKCITATGNPPGRLEIMPAHCASARPKDGPQKTLGSIQEPGTQRAALGALSFWHRHSAGHKVNRSVCSLAKKQGTTPSSPRAHSVPIQQEKRRPP